MFKIGDKVRSLCHSNRPIGTVTVFDNPSEDDPWYIGVRFNGDFCGHNLREEGTPANGWWFNEGLLEMVEEAPQLTPPLFSLEEITAES